MTGTEAMFQALASATSTPIPINSLTPGMRLGLLTLIEPAGAVNCHRMWRVRCICGAELLKRGSSMASGETKSCGPCKLKTRTPARLRHGHARRSGHSRTYKTWVKMRDRCENPDCPDWLRYGARGITICARWHIFENFLADMGEVPPSRSIDRIDNNGNYELGNCRWATPREQARNSRWTKLDFARATEIARRRLRGESATLIAADYGIASRSVFSIGTGRTWPDALAAARTEIATERSEA